MGQGSCSGSIYLDLGKQIQITDLGKVCIKEYDNPNEHVQDCCATGKTAVTTNAEEAR